MDEAKKLNRCICGDLVERYKDNNGKWFVYCSNCNLAFGVKLKECQWLSPGEHDAVFDTAEQARLAWNEWTPKAEL